MNPLIETLARLQSAPGIEGFLAALAVKGTVVLAVGFAASLLLRPAPAAVRHLAWCATFAGLLLLPLLAGWAPPLSLPVLPSGAARVAVERPAKVPDAVGSGAAPARGGAATPGVVPSSASAPATPPRGRGPALLLAAYLLGAVALVAYLVLGGMRVRWLRRGARPLDAEPGWRGLLVSLRHALGIRRPLALETTDRIAVPVAWGVRRPTVLLPAAAEDWDGEQRRDVLVHELAHVARHDWLSQLAARVTCALYWFHPLAWVAARRLVLEAERACDDRVLAAGSDSCDYAERLLRVAGAARAAREPSYAAVAMARRSDLATRVQAILDARVPRGTLRRAPAVLLAGALVLPAGVVAAARLTPAEAGPGTETAAVRVVDRGRDVDHDRDRERENGRLASGRLTPLLEAAGRGDAAEVRRLLAGGADLEAAVGGHGTALIRAAVGGHPDVVRVLLEAGADPNRTETDGGWDRDVPRSALAAAALSGSVQAASLLLARGARVDLVPRGDASALMVAAEEGHQEVVRLLLEAGADPNRVIKGDGSPLIAGVRGGSTQVVRTLLDAGARPDVWVDGDESPLYHAVASGDLEMVQILLDRGADPDEAWPGDGNALIQAASRGDARSVSWLLANGADPNSTAEGDGSPLIVAADAGRLDVVRLLVEEGADPDLVVPGDENPLIRAAGSGRLDVVRYLLDHGADPNVRTFEPPAPWRPAGEVRTALLQARRGGHDDVVRLLLDRGARE